MQSSSNGSVEPQSSLKFRAKNKSSPFMMRALGGLGCKGHSSSAASAPAVIRSAAQWDPANQGKKKKKKKKTSSALGSGTRNNPAANVVVDVPDVCCAPPGIGSASDVLPRPRNNTQRPNHREHSRIHRRAATQEETSALNLSASSDAISTRNQTLSTRNYPVFHHHSPGGGISEIVILRQNILYARNVDRYDQYGDWRLDVDHMGYEELLELGDRIGYVGTGLGEERILQFLKKVKHSNPEAIPLLNSNYDKDWKCSICQEGYKRGDELEVGRLECGHYYHIHCIKQWLLNKNVCPLCNNSVIR
ncbi:PREDICTED: E3 ubiquitin-protein ligase MBR1-like [Ipomoea nil]|uniref:E3 ubiquitin-protein ligase MBR1-like n=1 Tax=Ipomoea nil TaxID=35883 RepID=UPI0009015A97|nr:PREDICTED: E3 ubiquitin-protein ligase MBR1-like [Ipomoea nil]